MCFVAYCCSCLLSLAPFALFLVTILYCLYMPMQSVDIVMHDVVLSLVVTVGHADVQMDLPLEQCHFVAS